MRCVQFLKEEQYIKEFIKLSKKLYNKEENMQNDIELKQLLKEEHPLSKYFKLYKFLIYDNKKVVGRFAITVYENDNIAYLGFFECINSKEISNFLFENVYKFAKENGLKQVVGPVDASFWIKYRLKINQFDRLPYTGEPYNKAYYLDLFKENGYEVCEHYSSSIYNKVDKEFENEKYSKRLEEFREKGYIIESPDIEAFEKILSNVYYLIMDLYKDFPIFKKISEADFLEQFKSFRSIIDTRMIKIAYYNDEIVGFYISVPNYNNSVYNTRNFKNILKILKIKKKPNEYVMLYMGVDQKHTGLGKALVQAIVEELKEIKVPSIGALQRDGKITQKYIEELIENRYEYVLLKKEIS